MSEQTPEHVTPRPEDQNPDQPNEDLHGAAADVDEAASSDDNAGDQPTTGNG